MSSDFNAIPQISCLLSLSGRRHVTLCNHNYSHEGVFHPDRIMKEYDLLYMISGTWDIWEDDVCYRLLPEHVLLLEPGRHHYSLTRSSPEMRNVYIHFSRLCDDGINTPDSLCINKQLDCSNNRFVRHYYEAIIETYWSDVSSRDLRLSSYLWLLLSELSDLSISGHKKNDVLIEEIIHRFHCNPERFFSPAELAEDYRVSLRTISGRFKNATGQSIHSYQLMLKLTMAYDMLPTNPGRGLRDIAHSLGFYDEFQFSKLFKRHFGISPSQRREPQ